ncbi:MAG: hypothetical protein JW891_08440 [Candidatus Lokiarchaeota archaeon]|nr:hypothetical protein [Candidatus Lokiarchaeota archaeon]
MNRIESTVSYIENITESINLASLSSKENVDQLVEINTATEQQTASMQEVSSTASRLGTLAEELKEVLVQKMK